MASHNSCIFCKKSHGAETVEHIVPRSLGNLHYILPKGNVCRACNNKFAKFENKVLSSSLFLEERKRLGLLKPTHTLNGSSLSDTALRKFLLKIGFESLYLSKKNIWRQANFGPLLSYLMDGMESKIFNSNPSTDFGKNYKPIPGWWDRFRLRNNQIQLDYCLRSDKLFFKFRFGIISSEIYLAKIV